MTEPRASMKVLIVGGPEVGKSAIFRRWTTNKYASLHVETIKTNVGRRVVMDTDPYTGETTSTNVSLWDTVSDEKLLKVMKPAYVENLDALVIVTDATNPRSFQCIKQWQADIQEHCTKEGIALPVSIMLANKGDEGRLFVRAKEVEKSVQNYKLNGGFLCSAKSCQNLDVAFNLLFQEVKKAAVKNGKEEVGANDEPSGDDDDEKRE